ncbi:alpha/beta hydrolase [Pseudomonas protegens]|uniref:alpha/beta hydrolase n=1 Tax=Pseudomonas protegens TaxID=380021 RepID=UPI000C99C3BB|nr:alpha/beta hydrolase [Pseudomonas protegens]MCL9658769.1 alpha/beta hydrolase [Pseudomonas protegens]PNG30268.1 hypothetical protein A1348_23480 [Pseudomonas protegens]
MMRLKWLSLIALGVGVAGCSGPGSVMEPYESALQLESTNAKNFHSSLYFPSGTALHYPGYIVAIEKSPQSIVGGPKPYPQVSFVRSGQYINAEKPSTWGTPSQIRRFQESDSKAMFISHIIKNSIAKDDAGASDPYLSKDHCFVYNAYAAKQLSLIQKNYDLAKISDWHACSISTNLDKVDARAYQFYDYGKYALRSLEDNLTQDLRRGRYTHVLVIVMGWNTAQQEAIRNFNDLAGNLMAASLEAAKGLQESPIDRTMAIKPLVNDQVVGNFRPLVIGVTWPSYWSNSFGNVFSYSNKANDADEIGLSWLNKIINETIPRSLAASGSKARVVALGHSFGARAMTRAVFSSPVLVPLDSQFPDQPMVASPVDLAVGLQGAMSINRFAPDLGREGAPYRDYGHLQKTKVVLTAATNDSATGAPFIVWTDPAGSIGSYHKACDTADSQYQRIFECMTASDTSAVPGGRFEVCKYGQQGCAEPFKSNGPDRKVAYIDASNGITQFNSPGSGGGAHSDIYRLPMGRLLWKLIEEYAPTQ